ncbi:MAG: SEL1-like repeat protein, partial [Rikenella sp.]|nr:SEL1-like repeat protein [Rikenella sp.]
MIRGLLMSGLGVAGTLALLLAARWLPERLETMQAEEMQAIIDRAEAGDVKAQYELGELYYTGDKGITDWKQSVKWYRSAAEQGH